MKINCISCGHNIDLGDDYGDYEGLVKCWVCSALLTLRAEDGCAKSVLPASLNHREDAFPPTAEPLTRTREFVYGQEAH